MRPLIPTLVLAGALGLGAAASHSGSAVAADLLSAGDPSIAADGTVTIGDPCDSLSLYRPAPDVAYQPGIDAEGNPVAPADLDGSSGSLIGPDHQYTIDLTLPLGDAVDTPAGSGVRRVKNSDLGIGKVTVQDGQAYFDGKPMSREDEHALAAACAKRQAGQQN